MSPHNCPIAEEPSLADYLYLGQGEMTILKANKAISDMSWWRFYESKNWGTKSVTKRKKMPK